MSEIYLPASKAARRMACPGSRRLEEQVPRRITGKSEEARFMRHFIAYELNKTLGPCSMIDNVLVEEYIRSQSITNEMFEAARFYVNYIQTVMIGDPRHNHLKETLLRNDSGVIDFWYMNAYLECEHIFMFKWGHTPVDIEENWELLTHVNESLGWRLREVVLHIVQPRNYSRPIQIITPSRRQLREDISALERAEELALKANAPLNPGEHCLNCSANHMCPKVKEKTMQIKDALEIPEPLELTAEELSDELLQLRESQNIIKARIMALEEQIIFKLNQGENVPGFALGRVESRQRWTIGNDRLQELGALCGINLFQPLCPVTPKQALKLGLPQSFIAEITETPVGAVKLITEKIENINWE